MKNILAAIGLALVLMAPASFAQGGDSMSSDSGQVASGGSAGAGHSKALAYGGLAALGTVAFVATVVALTSQDDNSNVNVPQTGTTGTTGTTN